MHTMFQEAINHCRWKKALYSILQHIDVAKYEHQTFEEIMTDIYTICLTVRGIGLLTMYDITSAICRKHKIDINKVYIIGGGPKRAIQLLDIMPKIDKINNTIRLHYVDIKDIINAFDKKGFILDEYIRNCTNGDVFESYICNWQKGI